MNLGAQKSRPFARGAGHAHPRRAPRRGRQLIPVVALALLAVLHGGGVAAAAAPVAARATASNLPGRLDALMRAEDYVEAFAACRALLAERSAALGPLAPATLTALQRLGAIAHLSGDQDLAEELCRIALQRRREVLDAADPDLAESLYWYGLTAQYHADRTLARACFEEGMAILVKAGLGRGALAGALTQASASLLRSGNLPAAIDKYREALALRRAGAVRPSLDLADNETWLGWCLFRAGRFDEAMMHFKAAEQELQALGVPGHSLMGTIHNFYGNACAMRGDWPGAERFYRSTSEIFARCRDHYLTGYARRKIPVDGLDFLALAQLEQGREHEAWESLGRAHGQLTTEFVMMERWARTDSAGYRRVSILRDRYFQERRRYLEWWSRTGGRLPNEAWPSLLRSLELYIRIARSERDYLSIQRKFRPDYERLRQELDGKSALVGWLQLNVGADERRSEGGLRAWCWGYVARPGRAIDWFPLWEARSAAELRDILAPTRRYIRRRDRAANWATTAVTDAELADDARAVSRRWFDPLLTALEGVDRVIVDASNLPFFIPVDAFSLADGRHVCDAFSISYLPSLNALGYRQGRPASVPAPFQSALTVSAGNPLSRVGEDGAGPSMAATATRRELAALPAADREGERIAELFPSATRLAGGEATEARLLEMLRDGSLARFDVIHFATHAIKDDYPERSALLLSPADTGPAAHSDSDIQANEILRQWNLGARIVTLSGCESASWTGFGRGEFLGLVPALFGAGAQSVVGSQWPVQDRATSLFMTRFYENLLGAHVDKRGGLPPHPCAADSALREAKIWLRDYREPSGARPFEHPVYWSGYVLVGFP